MSQSGRTERNIENAKQLITHVINGKQLELCDRYLATDRLDHQDYGLPAGMADGHEGFRLVLGGFIEAFPDLHLDVQFVVADEDRVMFYVATTGTQRRSFMGLPATGRAFRVNGTDIFRFNDEGKIAEHWGVFDTHSMLTQLGHAGPAGAEPATAALQLS